MRALLKQRSRSFHFDFYGEPDDTVSEDPKASTSFQPKRRNWKRIKRIGLGVACILPIVIALEYYIVFHMNENQSPSVRKTFENPDSNRRFRVIGTVEAVRNGQRLPDTGATVMIWLTNAPANVQNAWVTFVDNAGQYDFVIPVQAKSDVLSVNIAIISESVASISSQESVTQPAKLIEHFPHPARQSNVFQYLIQESKPLRVNALFF
jgi:hypothetical protein